MHAVERAIASIAGTEDNIIDWEQLLAAGLGRGAIRHRVSAGSLQRVHRHLYLTGHAPPTLRGRARAAVFACGDDAVTSHRTAAELWDLLLDTGCDPEVTVAGRNPGVHPGIRVSSRDEHRSGRDLRPRRHPGHLARADDLRHRRDRAIPRGGARAAGSARALQPHRRPDPGRTRQRPDPERRPGDQTAAGRRPRPGPYAITGRAADALAAPASRPAGPRGKCPLPRLPARLPMASQRLVVEIDGYGRHGGRASFEADRRRDQVLVAAGFRVIRVTWRQLTEEPYGVIARIAQALAQGPGPAGDL